MSRARLLAVVNPTTNSHQNLALVFTRTKLNKVDLRKKMLKFYNETQCKSYNYFVIESRISF